MELLCRLYISLCYLHSQARLWFNGIGWFSGLIKIYRIRHCEHYSRHLMLTETYSMTTSWNENTLRITGPLWGDSLRRGPGMRSFGVSFDVHSIRWNLLICFPCICNRGFPDISFGDLLRFEHRTPLFSCLCMSMLTPNSSGNMQNHGHLGYFHAVSTRENISGVWGIGILIEFL